MKILPAAFALGGTILMLAAAGCQNDKEQASVPAEVQTGICRKDAAEALTGKDRVTDEAAKRATGATIVRQIKPGDPVTMDFRQERVTIETSPATGRIVRASCG